MLPSISLPKSHFAQVGTVVEVANVGCNQQRRNPVAKSEIDHKFDAERWHRDFQDKLRTNGNLDLGEVPRGQFIRGCVGYSLEIDHKYLGESGFGATEEGCHTRTGVELDSW